ncbi:MAG: DMT family transporter [Candidatus Cyclobacteriaceae bacterium M3_2C_046]
MPRNPQLKHFLELNLATLILGSSGILGKLINLPAPLIILSRSIIAFLFLYFFFTTNKRAFWQVFGKHTSFFIISGLFLAAHWVIYFIALKVSTVAIAFISVFTFPIITTLLEPVFFKAKLSWIDLFSSVLVLIGITLLIPELDFSNRLTLGVFLGVVSALFYALRNLLNKKYIHIYSGSLIMKNQLLVSSVILIPAMFFYTFSFSFRDVSYLLILGLVTTAVGHTLFVRSLKHFTASTASVISSLQPIYGIILAVIVLNEQLPFNVIAGGTLIITTVIFASIKHYHMTAKSSS